MTARTSLKYLKIEHRERQTHNCATIRIQNSFDTLINNFFKNFFSAKKIPKRTKNVQFWESKTMFIFLLVCAKGTRIFVRRKKFISIPHWNQFYKFIPCVLVEWETPFLQPSINLIAPAILMNKKRTDPLCEGLSPKRLNRTKKPKF